MTIIASNITKNAVTGAGYGGGAQGGAKEEEAGKREEVAMVGPCAEHACNVIQVFR